MQFRKLVSLMLAGCFITTTLPSEAMGRKYSDLQLNVDTFLISIQATETTTHNKALSGLLTRASEVTVRNGYKYFVVIDKQDHSEIENSSYLKMYDSGSASVTHQVFKIPHGQLTIKCYKKDPGKNGTIDAELFLKNKNTPSNLSSSWFGRKYSDLQLTIDTFLISIQATETTTQEKAISGLLTRASEVTVRNGYKYFVVTSKQDHSEIESSTYLKMYDSGSASVTHQVSKIPHGQLTIKCYKTDPQKNGTIDAELFLKSKK